MKGKKRSFEAAKNSTKIMPIVITLTKQIPYYSQKN